MGLFDKVKKKQKESEKEIASYGWDAITSECERVYVGQTSPKHYGLFEGFSGLIICNHLFINSTRENILVGGF